MDRLVAKAFTCRIATIKNISERYSKCDGLLTPYTLFIITTQLRGVILGMTIDTRTDHSYRQQLLVINVITYSLAI
jgi:hypothetical protein